MPLLSCLSRTWAHIQGNFFPWLREELGPLTETHKQSYGVSGNIEIVGRLERLGQRLELSR
jgi:hypothetical protein